MKTLVITDFSKTITPSGKPTTWSLFKDSGVFSSNYITQRDALFNKYHIYELEGNREKTSEWFALHLELLRREIRALYLLADDALSLESCEAAMRNVIKALEEKKLLEFQEIDSKSLFPVPEHINDASSARHGFSELLDIAAQGQVSLRIVSSGITEFMYAYIQFHLMGVISGCIGVHTKYITDKTTIIANTLSTISPVITPLNKEQFLLPANWQEYDRLIVVGDSAKDFPEDLAFTLEGPYQGFSFTDNEIIPGVVALGKEESLERIIDALK